MRGLAGRNDEWGLSMRTIALARLGRGCVALFAIVAATLTLGVGSASAANLMTNGSFETGNFTGWKTTDPNDHCGATAAWTVLKSPSSHWCFSGFDPDWPTTISAVKGRYFADVVWDGRRRSRDGPDRAMLSQKVSIPQAMRVNLSWWDNTSWDMSRFGAKFPRVEYLDILNRHGSAVLHSYKIQTLQPGTEGATDWVSHTLNLSRYAGRRVQIRFRLTIPERFTGPANFALDQVTLRAHR
jgi:hypothetical protein